MPEDDAAMADALARVTAAQWSDLWEALDAVVAETTHATWAGGQVVDTVLVDGVEKPVTQVPYPVYSDAVERLRSLVGQLGLIVPYDWMDWDGIHRYRGGTSMADAPATDAVRMLTAIIRSERFGDGNIEGALEDGTFQAALARLRTWSDTGT